MEYLNIKNLIQCIDKRIHKFLNEARYLKTYSGEVMSNTSKGYAQVRIFGSDTSFSLKNKTHEKLEVGESVIIECAGNDLNTGVISRRLRESEISDNIVVESKLADGWKYQKWSNGLIELWNIFEYQDTTLQLINHTEYFPFKLISKTNVQLTCMGNGAIEKYIYPFDSSEELDLDKITITYRNNVDILKTKISVKVVGKWK